jgi:hypothetical protein
MPGRRAKVSASATVTPVVGASANTRTTPSATASATPTLAASNPSVPVSRDV